MDTSRSTTTPPNARCAAWPGPQELLVRGIGCGRRACRSHLQPDWFGELNGLDPEAYLREVLTRIADHPINRIHELSAVESQYHPYLSAHFTDSWTRSNTVQLGATSDAYVISVPGSF